LMLAYLPHLTLGLTLHRVQAARKGGGQGSATCCLQGPLKQAKRVR